MGIGFTEGLLIAAIVLLFFGGKKIPQLGKTLGESVKNFKAGLKQEDGDLKNQNNETQGIPPFKDDQSPRLLSQKENQKNSDNIKKS